MFGIVILCCVISGTGYVLGWFGETAQVAKEEFGPRASLDKYGWFKDAAAQLDKKQADIAVYDRRLTTLAGAYAETPRQNWARDDREQHSVWASVLAGIKASYNSLAAEYNANMAKFNWRFAEQGRLPAGAVVALPREFKPYTEN